MLVRDINGKIVIVSRKNSINNIDYNNKLYDIRKNYVNKFASKIYINNINFSNKPKIAEDLDILELEE